jgi:Fe2+ transport system protein FeoA
MKPVIESDRVADERPLIVNTDKKLNDSLSLAQAKQGRQYKVVYITGGCEMQTRLASLGILPGQAIEIVQPSGMGPVLALVKGAKVALGHGVSHKILVRPELAASRTPSE